MTAQAPAAQGVFDADADLVMHRVKELDEIFRLLRNDRSLRRWRSTT